MTSNKFIWQYNHHHNLVLGLPKFLRPLIWTSIIRVITVTYIPIIGAGPQIYWRFLEEKDNDFNSLYIFYYVKHSASYRVQSKHLLNLNVYFVVITVFQFILN